MARMRTIEEAAKHIREKDPGTAITSYSIRRKVKSGEIPSWKSGKKYLIDIDLLEQHFINPVVALAQTMDYGKIRKISG